MQKAAVRKDSGFLHFSRGVARGSVARSVETEGVVQFLRSWVGWTGAKVGWHDRGFKKKTWQPCFVWTNAGSVAEANAEVTVPFIDRLSHAVAPMADKGEQGTAVVVYGLVAMQQVIVERRVPKVG